MKLKFWKKEEKPKIRKEKDVLKISYEGYYETWSRDATGKFPSMVNMREDFVKWYFGRKSELFVMRSAKHETVIYRSKIIGVECKRIVVYE